MPLRAALFKNKQPPQNSGFVTLLVTDGVPGLQIFDESEQQWCLVPAAAPWPPANDPETSRRAPPPPPPPPPSTSSVLLEETATGVGNLDGEEDGLDPEFPVFVNAGDMLHIWSNGLFRSALHRVALAEAGRDRYSAAYFFDPPWACRVEPIIVAADSDSKSPGASVETRPPLFEATTYGEYLVAKFKKTHASFEAAAGEEVEKRRRKRVEEE